MSSTPRLALYLLAGGLAAPATAQSLTSDANQYALPAAPIALTASATAAEDEMVAAPSAAGTASDDGWEASFTPYLWVAGTKGEVGVPRDGEEVDIDKSFTDVLGSLKFAFMGALDLRRKRFVSLTDIMYLSVGAKIESSRDPSFLSGKVDAKTLLASTAVGYRVVDGGPMFVDLLAGLRLFSLDVDLKLEGPQGNSYRANPSPSNVSPFVGGRMRLPLAEKWALGLYGDVGGLISDADVKWQLMGSLHYDISPRWRAIAGYRYMSIHHKKNDLDFDVSLSGPILGVAYQF